MGDSLSIEKQCGRFQSAARKDNCLYIAGRCVDQARNGAHSFVIPTSDGGHKTVDSYAECIQTAGSEQKILPRFKLYVFCDRVAQKHSNPDSKKNCRKILDACLANVGGWPMTIMTDQGPINLSGFRSCLFTAASTASLNLQVLESENPQLENTDDKNEESISQDGTPRDSLRDSGTEKRHPHEAINPLHPIRVNVEEGVKLMNAGWNKGNSVNYFGEYTQLAIHWEFLNANFPFSAVALFGRSSTEPQKGDLPNMQSIDLGLGFDMGSDISEPLGYRLKLGGGMSFLSTEDSGLLEGEKYPFESQHVGTIFAGASVTMLEGAIAFNGGYQYMRFALSRRDESIRSGYDYQTFASHGVLVGMSVDVPISIGALTGRNQQTQKTAMQQLLK